MEKKHQKISFGLNYVRTHFHLINSDSKTRNIAYFKLKDNLPFPDMCDAFDYLIKNNHFSRNELLIGKPLPQDYSELGDIKERPILGLYSKGELASVSLPSELNLVLIGVRKYKNEINSFLKHKEIYESCLLTGNYEEAESQLSKIEKDICYSLWSLENRFLLKEISGKASENKEFLSQFNENNKSKGLTKYLAHYLSLRAEHSLSINKYFNDLETSLNNLKDTDTKEAFQNYYRFKLTFLNHIDFNNHGEIIALDFSHSIIDRYLNLIKILINLLAVSDYFDENKEEKVVLKSYFKNRINYLIRKIDDPVLYKLKILSGDTVFPAFNIEKSRREISIIDNYTIGLYDQAEKELQDLLLENPNQFDLYVLYIKSLIYQKKNFVSIGNNKSLQNEILNDLYKIISVTTNPDQAALNLLRIANNITSCSLSYGIVDFVYFQTKGKLERKLLSRISYNFSNPIIYDVFIEDNDKKNFLNMLSENFPQSITIEFFKDRLKDVKSLIKYENKIPEGRFKVELGRKFQENNDFINASKEWEYLILNYKDTVPILETAVLNLFQCYLRLNQPNKCIDLFVDNFFHNNHIIDKIEVRELLENIHSNKFRIVEKNINLPIFYTIIDAGEVETHLAFELFNNCQSVEKPSELLTRINEFDEKKIMFFLEHTCIPKVLMHSTSINNSKERLEERLSIANFIREKDQNNKSIISEIKSIQNILVIQQGLIDLDESKIYVNEQGILDNELYEYEAIYERYEVISRITDKGKVFILDGGKLTTYSSQENTEVEKIEYSNNPVFDIYMELFNAVKDKFLNSQFGIVAYLSTRIRHGVLVGELRPIFETHNLITLKEGNSSKYRRNFYWDMIYNNFAHEEKEQIQITLSDFASKIDGLIFDLIKKHLQVYRLETNEDGWFNYEFDSNELWYHSMASIYRINYSDFVQGIFEVLWEKTDENLQFIRGKIQNEILNKFNELFDELERTVVNQLGESNSEPLRKSIKDCSTEIQTVIQKISRWFKRSEIIAADFSLSELINIVAEYTSKSSWQKRLLLTQEINFDCKIKGIYKTHFADLIRIFLENIIKHSGESAYELNCKITSSYEEIDNLKITIENEITDKNSVEELKSVWQGNSLDLDKLLSEKKSGYQKAFKILTSDLQCSKCECLKTHISEDEKIFSVFLSINIKDIKS